MRSPRPWPEPDFERLYGLPAAKRRKLYNGMIQCYLNMYE